MRPDREKNKRQICIPDELFPDAGRLGLQRMNRTREQIESELLALRAKRGETEALDDLLRRWQKRLWRFLRALCRDDETAWDLLQETCLSIAKSIRTLKRAEAFPAMAYQIARRRHADWVRSDKRRRETAEAAVERAVEAEHSGDHGAATETERIREAVARLDEDHRMVITLAYVEGFACEEIARMLELPLGTVKSRIHYAKDSIRREIGKETEA